VKGLGNLGQLMKQAKQMQEELQKTQAEIAEMRISGTAGGGMVTATVTGSGELTDLAIEPEVIDPEDSDMLVDLVIAAVQDAQRKAKAEAEKRLGPLTQGLGITP
jgi:DNA-binding YbaB/EbfC family protein